MKRFPFLFCLFFSISLAAGLSVLDAQHSVPTPESHFGFYPGQDKMMFSYNELTDYLFRIERSSDRILIKEVGKSSLGKPMYLAFFSSPVNLENLEKLREINKQLALNPDLSYNERNLMINDGKVFVYATLSMHSNEVGPSQAAPLMAYDLVTTTDKEKLRWMDDVVFIMMPCHNPDGMDMIVEYYNKTKDTRFEGATLPGVYHKYVGHNINRDFITLSQPENKIVASVYNNEWFPQVFVEKHQMGASGTRYFVPPNHDPIAENIDEGIWNWTRIFGANMMNDMTAEGLAGVSTNYLFDNYWPGSTETCIWKNVIGFLTEAANANIASPVYVEPNEIRVIGKGLSEHKKSINMPLPWQGGWWRLNDIVAYEISSINSMLKTAGLYKEEILKYRNDLCKKQVEAGRTQPPYYYVFPIHQHDQSELVSFVNLMMEHGIQVNSLQNNIKTGRTEFNKGDIIISLSQPYRAFIKEVIEKQEFPVRRYTPGGEIIKPYDITSWSIPLHRGIEYFEINDSLVIQPHMLARLKSPYKLFYGHEDAFASVFSVNHNESYKALFFALKGGLKVERINENLKYQDTVITKGSFIVYTGNKEQMRALWEIITVPPLYIYEKTSFNAESLKTPSIALVETYFHDMDAGWTRFILDTYYIPYKVLRPGEISSADLSKYDVILFPDSDKSILLNGKYKSGDDYYVANYEPSYSKGIEKEGLQKIMEYVHQGGKIVSWGRSSTLFSGTLNIEPGKGQKEEFQLPFLDLTSSLQKQSVFCPGSFISLTLTAGHKLTMGMKTETGVFYRGNPAFATRVPVFDMDRRVIGKIPEKDILQSGYCENVEKLANLSLMIWIRKNKGQMILMGFNPQFRASTHATYKLLFNSLLL